MEKVFLDSVAIIEAIDNQQKKLNLSRQDICALTGIPYSTFTSSIQKRKLPRFNDLYLIANAIGIPIDQLLKAPHINNFDKNNINYWIRYTPKGEIRRFLNRFPDKVAIARTIKDLSQEIIEATYLLPPKEISKTKDELSAAIFLHLLAMDEFYSVFCYAHIVEAINDFYVIKNNEDCCAIDFHKACKQLTATLWGYPNIAVENLWKCVDKLIPTRYPNTSAFLKDAGLNSLAYSKYLNASEEEASPSPETVCRVCSLLGIDDIDAAIRSKLPEIVEDSENKYQALGIVPHKIENKAFKDNLKSQPYLAMAMDMFFSLSYGPIEKIYYEVKRVEDTHPATSAEIFSMPFIQAPPSSDNPYILPSPLKNDDLIKDYGKTLAN